MRNLLLFLLALCLPAFGADNIANVPVTVQSGVPDSTDFPGAAGVVLDSDTGLLYFRTTGTVYRANIGATQQTLTDGATVTWDTNSGGIASWTLGASGRTLTVTNMRRSTYILNLIQDGTGSRTMPTCSQCKWPGGTPPTLTTTAGARDIVSCISDTSNLYCSLLPDVR